MVMVGVKIDLEYLIRRPDVAFNWRKRGSSSRAGDMLGYGQACGRREGRMTNQEADQADIQQSEAAAQRQSLPRTVTRWLNQAKKKTLTCQKMASEEEK